MAIWSSPKNFETVLEQSGTDFSDYYWTYVLFFLCYCQKNE